MSHRRFFGGFEQFVHVFDSLPVPMIIVDKNEKVQFLNDSYAEFLHRGKEDVIGEDIVNLIENSRIPIVMKTGKAEIAWRHKFVDGQEAIVHRIPITDDGEIVGCFGMLLFSNLEELQKVAEQNRKLADELKYYKNELRSIQGAKYAIDNIIGVSREICETRENILKVCKSRSTVLVLGESGTGKELVAHAIHNESPRSQFPFIRVNCAAIPDTLLESELFGYEEGAFTGAKKGGQIGKIELANKGTLFLDEIGDMPPLMQTKMLRVLQEKEIERIGGKKNIAVDVRFIAATNKNLEQMVERGQFRADLFYRLNILTVGVPSLRERKADIPLLAGHLLAGLYQELGIVKKLDEEVVRILEKYSWPGNVRELKNVLEKMLINAVDATISVEDIPLNVMQKVRGGMPSTAIEGLDQETGKFEKELIRRVLKSTNRNIKRSAEILRIPRPRLYRLIKRYDITRN